MCPKHTEPKQTEASEFGAEKDLLQGQGRTGDSSSKTPNSMMVCGGKSFWYADFAVRALRCGIFFWLIGSEATGQYFKNLVLRHPPFGWVGAKNLKIILCISLEEEPGPYFDSCSTVSSHKGPYGQNYGFSSSHVWMWELDHKEPWVLYNEVFKMWC